MLMTSHSKPEEYLAGFPVRTRTETITYLLPRNGDSMGNRGDRGHGDVQWMTAGSVSSKPGDAAAGAPPATTRGFQYWANLASQKMMPPLPIAPAATIPEVVRLRARQGGER